MRHQDVRRPSLQADPYIHADVAGQQRRCGHGQHGLGDADLDGLGERHLCRWVHGHYQVLGQTWGRNRDHPQRRDIGRSRGGDRPGRGRHQVHLRDVGAACSRVLGGRLNGRCRGATSGRRHVLRSSGSLSDCQQAIGIPRHVARRRRLEGLDSGGPADPVQLAERTVPKQLRHGPRLRRRPDRSGSPGSVATRDRQPDAIERRAYRVTPAAGQHIEGHPMESELLFDARHMGGDACGPVARAMNVDQRPTTRPRRSHGPKISAAVILSTSASVPRTTSRAATA